MERPFRLTSDQAEALATEFGTPLYVLSEDVFVESIRAFKSAAAQHLVDHQPRISFATKSNGTLALLQIAYREGCHIDVASEGELRGALRAGVPARECTLHGNNKSEQELAFALDEGIGEIVIDSFDEIRRLLHLALRQPVTCQLTLRVNPHLDLGLNAKVATASVLSKFGFQPRKEEIGEAVRLLAQASLSVTGLHCHLGSQIFSPDAHARAGASLLELMSETPEADWKLLNLGGGFGIPYTNEVPIRIAECLENVSRLKMPDGLRIAFEPGRSLVGEAGLTLYQVGTIKEMSGVRLASVDGGLADNPRPTMYDARYTVEGFSAGPVRPATVVGRHCENDVLHPDVFLPDDLKVGDLIQVLCTGAYSSSMASNYNRYPRPATVLISLSGKPQLVQKRETYEDMLAREVLL